MNRTNQLRKLIFAALFAALIFIGISILRIPIPAMVGRPFIHFGNTLTDVAVMLLGFGYGGAAGAIGLGLFDILNGYAATSWLTILEALILAAVVNATFRAMRYDENSVAKLYVVSLAAGLIKIITSWGTGVIEAMIAGTTFKVAALSAFLSLPAAVINSIASFILVPLIYMLLVRLGFGRARFN